MADSEATPGLSLWRGGLFYRLSQRFPKAGHAPLDDVKRNRVLLAVTWVPFVVLAIDPLA